MVHINRFVQERRNSIANALELPLSCTNPLICVLLSFNEEMNSVENYIL